MQVPAGLANVLRTALARVCQKGYENEVVFLPPQKVIQLCSLRGGRQLSRGVGLPGLPCGVFTEQQEQT